MKIKFFPIDYTVCKVPCRSTTGSAGYDLFSNEVVVIPGNSVGIVCTGTTVKMPKGIFGMICPRSGLAIKKFIGIGGGVIDSDYEGEIKVIVFNHGNEDFIIDKCDRIAQIIFQRYVISDDEILVETKRGDKGFGSTGK